MPKTYSAAEKQTIAIVAALMHIASCKSGRKRTAEEAISAAATLVDMVDEHCAPAKADA